MSCRRRFGETLTETLSEVARQTTIAGRRFAFRAADVRAAAHRLEPEPIDRHYVVVGPHRFPPKQLLRAMTGLDRADLTTHQARRTLVRLGFVAGRRPGGASRAPVRADSMFRVPGDDSAASGLVPP